MEGVCRKSGEGGAVKVENRIESNIDEERFKEGIVLKENILDSEKKKMGEVRNENQILKRHLTQIMKDYQTLQMQFNDIIGQEAKESTRSKPYAYNQEINEEPEELVSLSLGRRSREPEKYYTMDSRRNENEQDEEGLSLGLDSKFRLSTETSMKQSPEKEDARLSWSPNKVLKTTRSDDELEVTEPKPSKRARVSVRVRSNAPTMNDGGQWRKYGQKIAKGNPCPRAYYRCTIAPSCPVRKQVQRSADDMSVLITTYEGTHNHPLPISAIAMASTTSAAASMLVSGPSSSSSGTILNPSTSNTTNSALLYLSNNSKPKQYYLPHSSISSSPLHPTISLDFTSTSSSSHLFSNAGSSSTNLNFGCLESNPLPFSLNFGRQPQGNYFQSFMQKPSPNYPPQQTLPLDTITAATKAITSDQKFQSALAIALTSIIGNR